MLYKIRAIGFINGYVRAHIEEETYYLVVAENERQALERFHKIKPEIDPDFEIETLHIELYTTDYVAIVDESMCAI